MASKKPAQGAVGTEVSWTYPSRTFAPGHDYEQFETDALSGRVDEHVLWWRVSFILEDDEGEKECVSKIRPEWVC